MTEPPITPVAAPWTLRGTIYMMPFWMSAAQAQRLPPVAYSPLEGSSAFASPEGGRPVGGLSMIQLIRYTESPVGPYDELILAPGYHAVTVEEKGRMVSRSKIRITRIYVSQKDICWNGRKSTCLVGGGCLKWTPSRPTSPRNFARN